MTILIFFLIGLFILGTILGSFTSMLVYRLHAKEHPVFKGRSICPQCKTRLSAKDLIPLVSYLLLRGKCRHCKQGISYMYPLIELLNGSLLVLLFLKFPFVDNMLIFDVNMLIFYILYAFYTLILLFTFFFDLHYKHVADEILLPGILIGLLATFHPKSPHFVDALIGLAIPVLFFSLQYLLSKGTWIGAGDIRVGAFMGVILGFKLVIVALVISYLIGSIISIFIALKLHKFTGVKIPFAPFLVAGTFLTIFFGDRILNWYLSTLYSPL